MNKDGMTCLLTGAAGFIGSALLETLIRTKYAKPIICVDSLLDNYDWRVKWHNLETALFSSSEEISTLRSWDCYFARGGMCTRCELMTQHFIKNFGFKPNHNNGVDNATTFDGQDSLHSCTTTTTTVEFCHMDLNMEDHIDHLLRKLGPTRVINQIVHLAGIGGVRASFDNTNDYLRINIASTILIMKLARMFNTQHVFLASSSSVYGDIQEDTPSDENSPCDMPVSPYAASKRSAEIFAYAYHCAFNINVTCFRLFTVYGPRCRHDMATYKFIDAIHNGQPVHRYGDGSSKRCFTYISDICDGIYSSMQRKVENLEYFTVNLGGDKAYTVNEWIQGIENAMNCSALINEDSMQLGDVKTTLACQQKAKELLNFEPKVDMRTGLIKTVQWYLKLQTWLREIGVDKNE